MVGAREALLERVIDHVARTGLADQSLRELAAGAGTSHRMLLYHFGSRAGLVAAVAGVVEAQQREAMEAMASEASTVAELQRRLWAQVSAPEVAPFVRLFFDVLGLALAGTPGTEAFRENLVRPWLDAADGAAHAVGAAVDEAELRLGMAVTRGLLIDLLATGDVAGVARAHDRFLELWDPDAT